MSKGRYESEMLGEHPSRKRPHINYEADMKGEKVVKKAYKAGGAVKKMAAGGAAKVRKGVATASGKPVNVRNPRAK